jgi:hypothetical protein
MNVLIKLITQIKQIIELHGKEQKKNNNYSN